VIVNDRVDIALAARADGVHLGTGDLPIAEARLVAGHRLLIGSSAHDLEEAGAAIRAGCDLCGLGTMYASTTKPECVPSGGAGGSGVPGGGGLQLGLRC
jgi:thiamine-phosphate pyrophosphorylase